MTTISNLITEQTTQVTDDSFVMQTSGGVTKKIKATNMKLVGFDDYLLVQDPASMSSSASPNLTTFRGNIKLSEFSGSPGIVELFGNIHVHHNYVLGTDISFHVHWSHIEAVPSGNVNWKIDYSIAKGFGVEAFPAPTTINLTQTAAAQYTHQIIEGSDITSASIEPDSLILVRLYRDTNDVLDTFSGSAFFIRCDIHVSVDGRATNEKARPFTKV